LGGRALKSFSFWCMDIPFYVRSLALFAYANKDGAPVFVVVPAEGGE